ncbi:MAG: NAD(P)/FAD-dependent oxidoreductase [Clostridia bacterium]
MFDCIIVGGGVVGASILDCLSRRGYKVLLLEKGDDVAVCASRANSGIVHAGYDCLPKTLKAIFNVLGNAMYPMLCDELDVPFKKVGSIVVSDEAGRESINELYNRGLENGVKVQVVERERLIELEPNIAKNMTIALYAPDAGVVSPYKLTVALVDRAILNGAEVKVDSEVTKIDVYDSYFAVKTAKFEYKSKFLINAAGSNANIINRYVGEAEYPTEYKKGEYFVLDNTEGDKVNCVIFPLPDERGKGILVAPTADGNVLYGPTSIHTNIGDTSVDSNSLTLIRDGAKRVYKNPNFKKVIRLYAGLRTAVGDDFVIKKSDIIKNYFILAGICSPGLSAAPAIGNYIADLICAEYPKPMPLNIINNIHHQKFTKLTPSEHAELVKNDEKWGRIICRCEKITEAEIVNAIHSPLPATTVDAVKRRVRAGMGRCQGGFCAPRVMEIISRELNIPLTAVKKGGEHSEIAVCRVKEVDNGNL